MSYRKVAYRVYWFVKRLVYPHLEYSQNIYERYLARYCKDRKWLDLGCGTAILPPWRRDQEKELISCAGSVIGLDYEMDSLKRNRSISSLVRGDISHLPFADGSFDIVTSNMVFEHLKEPDRQLAEIWRILSPGGLLVFHTMNTWGYVAMASRLIPEPVKAPIIYALERRKECDVFPTHYRINSRKKIECAAQETGFEVERISYLNSDAKFAMFAPLALLELFYLRLLMLRLFRGLRPNLIVVLRKP
jgi:ubiquinone/menaquinone biosynthesis C-methylase UbiE